ncbi:KV15 protein, partial [Atractosteus spatula]|nr:KV15 protein [Atractosteus spatula]
MTFITIFTWTLLISAQGRNGSEIFDEQSSGQVTVTQTPAVKSVLSGQTVNVNCKTSAALYNNRFKRKLEKFLIYAATIRQIGIPEHFSGSGSGTDFTLTITGMPECSQWWCTADYYCLAHSTSGSLGHSRGNRHLGSGNALPSLSLLPPSTVELSAKRSATLLCLANKGFPSDWSLQWKIDGSSKSSSVTKTPGILESDGTYSWSSTLTLSEPDWKSLHSMTCEASQGSQATVQKTQNKSDCPE